MTQKQAETKVLNKHPKAIVEEDYRAVMQWVCITGIIKPIKTIGSGTTIADAWKDAAANVL